MIQQIIMYAALICIPITAYFSYDYGVAKQLERSQVAADKLTTISVGEAEKLEVKKEKERIVYRNIIHTVEIASDPTKCLDTHPGADVANELRKLQSL